MNSTKMFAAMVFVFAAANSCLAYETETHALITNQAYQRSILAQSGHGSVVNILALDRLDQSTPFDSYWLAPSSYSEVYYLDGGVAGVSPNGFGASIPPTWDNPENFEHCQMSEFLKLQQDPTRQAYYNIFNSTTSVYGIGSSAPIDSVLPIQNWLVRGAIREDDLGTSILGYVAARASNCGSEWWDTSGRQPNRANVRSYNHFYDPFLDIGLTTTILGIPINGKRSVDWALGYVQSLANPPQVDQIRGNSFSYTDARNMFFWALTREVNRHSGQPYTASEREADARDRMYLWATTFRSIGNVVHLLEDTGQPQHTRNDPHSAMNSDEQQAFEGYTNARVLGQGDVGGYVRAFFNTSEDPLTPPPLGNYDAVSFASPARFFTTRGDSYDTGDPTTRAGLADYTNRGFFTGGSLPGEVPESSPPKSLQDPSYSILAVPCVQLAPTIQLHAVVCSHYTRMVGDVVSPNYPDQLPSGFSMPQVPVLSESVFSRIIAQNFDGHQAASYSAQEVAISPTELDTIGNMTIPRAVGYATGMINFFFRGVGGISVTPPSSGVFAILDHGQPHSINAEGYPCAGSATSDGCPIFGFTAVQANIQNTMPPITESDQNRTIVAQHMTTGTLVAVARYHRNTCYEPDLSGDVSVDMNTYATAIANAPPGSPVIVPVNYPPSCPTETSWSQGRSPFPEISKSLPITVDASGMMTQGVSQPSDLNGSALVLVQFDFSGDPIPVNATDLYLEIVFNGVIGDASTQDANKYEVNSIAVGSVDVSEPTYSIFMNLANYYYDTTSQTWMTFAQAQQLHLPVQQLESGNAFNIPAINACVGSDALVKYGNGGNPAPGLAVGHAIRFAAIMDPNAPASGNLLKNSWVAPVAGYYNGVNINAGGTVLGAFGTVANGIESNPQSPFYVVHKAQASLESNALGDYSTYAFNAAAGAIWGDNIFFFYESGIGADPSPQKFLPTTPLLTGSTGVFLPDPIPTSEIFLNVPNACGSN